MQQNSIKKIEEQTRLREEGDLLGIMQETFQLYMHKPEFLPENETFKILWDFEIQLWPDDKTFFNLCSENYLPYSDFCRAGK